MKPIIAIDVDGVLLFWQTYAVEFCEQNGLCTKIAEKLQTSDEFINPFEIDGVEQPDLIVKYNQSEFMERLKYYHDALEFISTHKDYFDFVAITAMSPDELHLGRRRRNLENVFGRGVFQKILGCNIRESKKDLFHKVNIAYRDRVVAYIDDMAHHLNDAKEHLPNAKLFHIIRDIREGASVPCTIVNKLTQINLVGESV